MTKPPRGICPECRTGHALRATGTLGAHNQLTRQGYTIGRCPGVDQLPIDDEPPRDSPRNVITGTVTGSVIQADHITGPITFQ
ncbi:hypothetical protein [Actinocrispum wychmicini]|uniref:Uncharacterized protein n=1 Tax=Actinocrispum wychmicini TaxID=1213861 RepID=A0A4V2S6R9_9PSEU|nr:hypothetical protein [Actinocrispum wychmicini]TCO57160.1 hypothetical protein EV192_106637 [Actinocrispum wychmicini]